VRSNRLLAYALITSLAAGCKASAQGEVKSGADAESTDQVAAAGGEGAKTGPSRKTADLPPPSGPATATYPAFEVMPDGQSVITVYVRGPVQVTEQKVEGRLVYLLNGVGVSARVNRMPLLTQEFPTQVTSVSLEQAAGGANLIVELREPAKATYKVSDVDGGTMVSVIVPKSEKYGRTTSTAPDKTLDEADKTAEESATDSEAMEAGSADVPANADEETARRKKKSRREPKPYVMRSLTLAHKTLAPDIAISVAGQGTGDPLTMLTGGVRYGIIDQLEIEATPHSFRLQPEGAYAYPSVGLTAGYTGNTFEIGGRARYFIGVDSGLPDPVNGGALLVGVPIHIHLSSWGRIDTGAFMTLDFRDSDNGVHPGLYNSDASPFYVDDGVPFNFLFQPNESFWLGPHLGVAVYDFEDVEEQLALPVGAEIGFTASDDFNPNADLCFRVDFPRLIMPAAGDKIQEDFYSLALWFRWYYHL
jgi:hypothetical protein